MKLAAVFSVARGDGAPFLEPRASLQSHVSQSMVMPRVTMAR
jgi:hypothetical protein